MQIVRRINPLSWRLGTVNRIFGTLTIVFFTSFIVFSVSTIARATPVALLTIPGVDLENAEIVLAPPSDRILPTPDQQIGLYSPSENVTFLYGHSDTIFAGLENITLGGEITFTDLETHQPTVYTVTDIETLPHTDIHMPTVLAARSEPTLILMTCAGSYDESIDTYDARLIVTAHPAQ